MAKKDEATVGVAVQSVASEVRPTTVRMRRDENGVMKYADVHPVEVTDWTQHGWVIVE